MNAVTLQPDELEHLTGYEQATKQLDVLHKRGFTRAFIGRRGLVLPSGNCTGPFFAVGSSSASRKPCGSSAMKRSSCSAVSRGVIMSGDQPRSSAAQ